jgi:hypothetical protein
MVLLVSGSPSRSNLGSCLNTHCKSLCYIDRLLLAPDQSFYSEGRDCRAFLAGHLTKSDFQNSRYCTVISHTVAAGLPLCCRSTSEYFPCFEFCELGFPIQSAINMPRCLLNNQSPPTVRVRTNEKQNLYSIFRSLYEKDSSVHTSGGCVWQASSSQHARYDSVESIPKTWSMESTGSSSVKKDSRVLS